MTPNITTTNEATTYVLLHGAFHGGWCWRRVAEPLRAAGHRVFTPTLTGLGERAHLISTHVTIDVMVNDLVNVLEFEDLNNVVLVAHSFGGIVATGALAHVRKRLAKLVLLDSLLVLKSGNSPFMAIPPEAAAARRKQAQVTSSGVSIPVPEAAAFGVTAPQDAAWLNAKCTPHPLASYESPLHFTEPVASSLPVTYVAVTPYYSATVTARDHAKTRSDWRYIEIEAGHDAMVTSPEKVLQILRDL